MKPSTSGLFVGALLCAAPHAFGASPDGAKKKPDVPVYTDDDLRRVSPLRDQTGGGNAPPPAPAAQKPEAGERTKPGRGEGYWRGEAERLRDRLHPLRERAADLRVQIEERRRRPGVRPYSDPGVESLQRRLHALEQRIRDAEDRLHERARREGAWPSWLR